MGKYLQSLDSFQNLILKSFGQLIPFKPILVKHYLFMLLYCMGGDADYDFVDKRVALVKANNVANGSFFYTNHSSPLTSPTDYFRSIQNGNWLVAATWESSTDNINWQAATDVPTKDANVITIQSGHTVSVSNSVSLDQTIISGRLELLSGGVLNINDGTGDDITILGNGILQVISTVKYTDAIQQSPGASINIATGGKITVGNGVTPVGNGYEGFATSMINKWNDGAIYEWNNANAFATSAVTYFPNSTASVIPVFKITEVAPAVGSGSVTTFNGIVEIDKDFTFTGGSTKNFRNGIAGSATLTQNATVGNSFRITGANAILGGSSLKIILAHPMYFDKSVIVPTDSSIRISGANVDNNVPGNVFTINGTLDMTSQQITNTNGAVVVNGIYRTSISGGFAFGTFTNTSIPSGTVEVKPASTIELYALGDQNLNPRTDFANLIFSGSGIKKAGSSFIPNGTILIKDEAIFNCNGHNVGNTTTNLTMQDNSRLIVDATGTQPSMEGIYTLTGGTIEFANNNITFESIRTIAGNYNKIEVSGKYVRNSTGNINLNSGASFTVNSTGTFSINDDAITGPIGSQTLTIKSGGTFNCGNSLGFYGALSGLNSPSVKNDIEYIILEEGSTINYSRSDPPLVNGNQVITPVGVPYQNLILSGTGIKTAPVGTLEIKGNLSKSGTAVFAHNNGTVSINGASAQTYNSTSPQMEFYNLINNNSVGFNVNDSLAVYRLLTLNDGSKITLNKDISLRSDKKNTASVGKINTGMINYGLGRFIVERYINSDLPANGGHHKSWQFIATPAFGETIYDTWQEGGNTTITGYGTWITDPSFPAFGFDGTSPSPSMKSYTVATNSWEAISGTNIPLSNPKGYMLFVRGDRQSRGLASDPSPTVLRTKGKLYSPVTGYEPPLSFVGANNFQSIGNPYASVIDFTKVTRSNVDNKYYAWDPSVSGYYGVGGYQTISSVTGWKAIPGESTIYNSSDDYRYIQSGQAFFVYNSTVSGGTLSFNESSKMDDNNHLVFRGPDPNTQSRQLLIADLFNAEGRIADGNAVGFDVQYSSKIDKDDALKISNAGENFGLRRENKILAVEARQNVSFGDTIFYDMRNLQKTNYTLLFVPQNMENSTEAFLIDQYLKTEQAISLTDTSKIKFSVNSELSSAAYDRFMLVFRAAAAPLPVTFISVNALFKNNAVLVNWKVENEFELVEYEIEHSADGIHFTSLSKLPALNNGRFNYEYFDDDYNVGYNYYRIKSFDKAGKIEYSSLVKIQVKTEQSVIKVSKSFDDNIIRLQFINQQAGKYKISLYNSTGQLLKVKDIIYAGGSSTQIIEHINYTAHGVYYVEILKANTGKLIIKLIK